MDDLSREVEYRQMVRRIEELIHQQTPRFSRRPRKLSQEMIVRLARNIKAMEKESS